MSKDFELTSTEETFEADSCDDLSDELLTEEDEDQVEGLTSRQKIILVGVGAAIVLCLLGLMIALLMFSGRSTDNDHILQNVFACGVDLSGMTLEEATSALHSAADASISREPMVVRIYDSTLTLDPRNTKASLDVEALAQAAYNYGRTGNQSENQKIRQNAHRRTYTIPLLPYLNLDLSFIQNTVDSYCADLVTEYAEPVVTLVGSRPVYGDPSPQHQSLQITLGTPLRQIDAKDLYNQILDAYSMNELLLEYETPEPIWPTVVKAQDLFNQYCTPAQDATLNTSTYQITPESYGYGFQESALQQLLDQARPGETVEITMSFLEPEILAQDISSSLFSITLSSCKSTSLVDENARDANLAKSCKAVDGYIIKPGETFSYTKVLGKITSEAGYVKAPICSVNEISMGGGISQTATALYYCALYANLDIVERHSHQYATDFIELGLDAYVDGKTHDLRFRNNTRYPIRIDASLERHTVSVSFQSEEPLQHTVSVRTEITKNQRPSTSYQMVLPDNDQGYQDGSIITTGVEGYSVSVWKVECDTATGKELSKKTVSNDKYEKRDEIIARIGVLETTPPTESTLPQDSADVADSI